MKKSSDIFEKTREGFVFADGGKYDLLQGTFYFPDRQLYVNGTKIKHLSKENRERVKIYTEAMKIHNSLDDLMLAV